MPKTKIRTYIEEIKNTIDDNKITLIDIAKMLIKAGAAKQTDVRKLAGSLSNRIYNDGFLDEKEIEAIEKFLKSDGKTIDFDNNLNEKKELDKYTACVYADYYPDIFGDAENRQFVPSKNCVKVQIPEFCFMWPPEQGCKYSMIHMHGNSMTPSINNGDKIIIRHTKEGEAITDNNIYAFIYDNKLFVRRLFDNLNEIIIKSDNPDFGQQTIPKNKRDDFLIIGWLVGLMWNLR